MSRTRSVAPRLGIDTHSHSNNADLIEQMDAYTFSLDDFNPADRWATESEAWETTQIDHYLTYPEDAFL